MHDFTISLRSMILCRCVDSLISPPPLSPRKSPQYLHFVFKPFFCSRSTYPICCVYLWVSPQLSIYGRAVHQYFSLVSCCCQIGRPRSQFSREHILFLHCAIFVQHIRMEECTHFKIQHAQHPAISRTPAKHHSSSTPLA